MIKWKTVLGTVAVAIFAAVSVPALKDADAGEPRNLETRDHGAAGTPESDLQESTFEPLNSGGKPAVGITRREREIIENFLTGHRGSIALWQQSLERQAPGVRDELVPGQPLPPGVQGKELPPSFADALPPRVGSLWLAVGYSLVLIDRESGRIRAVWPNALDID